MEAHANKMAALPKDNKMEATENCYQEIAMVAHK
jgi:hypothetical protein